MEDENLWKMLIRFLERELKVQPEKSMIYKTWDNLKEFNTRDKRDKDEKRKEISIIKGAHINHQSLKCHFCGELDHIPTNGPGGTKIIQ